MRLIITVTAAITTKIDIIRAKITPIANGDVEELGLSAGFGDKHCVFGPVWLVTPLALPSGGAV